MVNGKHLLHVGAGNLYEEGFVNADLRSEWKGKPNRLDVQMDMGKPWPFESGSFDGIVGMHVYQQLHWRELVVALRESYRVLKPGGVLRIGGPMVEHQEFTLDYLLGWNNVNLFSEDLLRQVMQRVGFSKVIRRSYHRSIIKELARLDNRRNRASSYYDIVK